MAPSQLPGSSGVFVRLFVRKSSYLKQKQAICVAVGPEFILQTFGHFGQPQKKAKLDY